MPVTSAFRPYATRGRRPIVAILVTFALFTAVSVTLSIWATSRSEHRAAVLQAADRQQTLAGECVEQVLLVRSGERANPAATARALARGASTPRVKHLVADLTATGAALLGHRPMSSVRLTAGEHLDATDPLARLRTLAALTATAARTTPQAAGAGPTRTSPA